MTDTLTHTYVSPNNFPLLWPSEVMQYCRHWKHADNDAGILERHCTRAKWAIAQLDPYLRKRRIETYLDIGCGMGAIPAALANQYKINQIFLIEADIARAADITGYNASARPWNDVSIAEQMVKANNPTAQVFGLVPALLPRVVLPKLDLITSFRSWCHHYPASEYLELVCDRLAKDGLLCVDVRTSSDNLAVLESAGFRALAWLSEGYASPKKTKRYVFERIL